MELSAIFSKIGYVLPRSHSSRSLERPIEIETVHQNKKIGKARKASSLFNKLKRDDADADVFRELFLSETEGFASFLYESRKSLQLSIDSSSILSGNF